MIQDDRAHLQPGLSVLREGEGSVEITDIGAEDEVRNPRHASETGEKQIAGTASASGEERLALQTRAREQVGADKAILRGTAQTAGKSVQERPGHEHAYRGGVQGSARDHSEQPSKSTETGRQSQEP